MKKRTDVSKGHHTNLLFKSITEVGIMYSQFSMSSGERQRKSRGTLTEQEMYKRYSRGRAGAHELNNRGTEVVQQRYKR